MSATASLINRNHGPKSGLNRGFLTGPEETRSGISAPARGDPDLSRVQTRGAGASSRHGQLLGEIRMVCLPTPRACSGVSLPSLGQSGLSRVQNHPVGGRRLQQARPAALRNASQMANRRHDPRSAAADRGG